MLPLADDRPSAPFLEADEKEELRPGLRDPDYRVSEARSSAEEEDLFQEELNREEEAHR